MPEDTANKDIPFLKETANTEILAEPAWRKNVLEGMSVDDQRAMKKLRSFFFQRNTPMRWYYSGSGRDLSPTFVAPLGTEHFMVDVGYDRAHRFFRSSHNTDFAEPYKKLGANVEAAIPWEEGWKNRKQTVVIDGNTRLQLIGGKAQDRDITPDSIDVIYTNPYSTSPGPDALIALKTGGFYVVGSDSDEKKVIKLLNFENTLENFGFRAVKVVEVDNLHFPSAGKVAGTSDGKPIWYQIYEKSRSFTPEEEDILQLDSSLWEMKGEVEEFVFRYDTGDFPEEEARKMEASLLNAFSRYFHKLQNLKGQSEELSTEVKASIESYFPDDGSLPESLQNHYLLVHRNQEKVLNYHQLAAKLYRSTKDQITQ